MEQLQSIDDLAKELQIPKGTLYQWRSRGIGPPGIKVGRFVRYRPQDVRRWLEERASASA